MKFTSLLRAVNQTKLVLARRRIEVRRQIEEEEHMLRMLVEEEETRPHVGSVAGRRVIDRDREHEHQRLFRDYYFKTPVFDDIIFRRRFRMRRPLFLRIMEDVKNNDSYFVQKRNAAGTTGFSTH
ncbi:hypothetical protein G6F56_005257 [Rhizopus delemar]|nr:hypothetical protein G6F56_005257 [Rhizopus delemar]